MAQKTDNKTADRRALVDAVANEIESVSDHPTLPASTWKFELGGRVQLNMSNEVGVVIGRAQYLYCMDQYFVRYVTSDARQVEGWQSEDSLIANRSRE